MVSGGVASRGVEGEDPEMDIARAFSDGLEEVGGVVHDAVGDLSLAELTARPGEGANTIAWLVWHLTRVLDDHLAPAFGHEQRWFVAGWAERFALPFPPEDDGYGQTADQVAAVRLDATGLLGYFDDVRSHTLAMLDGVDPARFDERVATPDGETALGTRLVRTFVDVTQHAGQAAFVRGMVVAR